MSFKTASAIFKGHWFIDHQWAEQHLPIVAALLKGDTSLLNQLRDGKTEGKAETFSALSIQDGEVSKSSVDTFSSAPVGAIAAINITGPILKYGDMCSYGAMDYADMVKAADQSPNISSILLIIDSPGGQVSGTQTLVQAIADAKKPVIAFVNDGMMASAAMWIGSAADEIYASMATDMIGSVGSYATLLDFKGALEQNGVKVHEIYAPQSTMKNNSYNEAVKGNYDPMRETLSVLVDTFIQSVIANRGEKAASNIDSWGKGQLMFTPDAIKAGLIDGIKSFDQVVQRASEIKTKKNSNNTTMFNKNFAKLSALKGMKAENLTSEILESVNEELVASGIENVTLVADADLSIAATAQQNATQLTEKITSLEGTINTLTTEKDNAVKALNDFKAERAEGKTISKKDGTDELPGASSEEGLTEIDVAARTAYNKNFGQKK